MNIQINSGQSIFGGGNSQSAASATQALSDAFRNELSSVLQQTLGKYGINASGITISVDPASSTGQARQNIVTGSIAAALAPASTPTPATASAAGSIAAALAPTATPPRVETPVSITSPAPVAVSFDEAYWAGQPAAVRQLQNIQDPDQRAQLATQLTEEGYKVDVPIMVWGWDPQKVTDLRHSFGYTWVPSAGQASVKEAPGLNVYGLQPYDPANAPANSIQVA